MSKSKFKVTKGLAQIITTGEPVFVLDISEDGGAVVVRPVVTQNGVDYREETFSLDQLETRFEAAKRTVELEAFVQGLREEVYNKKFSLPASVGKALEAQTNQQG